MKKNPDKNFIESRQVLAYYTGIRHPNTKSPGKSGALEVADRFPRLPAEDRKHFLRSDGGLPYQPGGSSIRRKIEMYLAGPL